MQRSCSKDPTTEKSKRMRIMKRCEARVSWSPVSWKNFKALQQPDWPDSGNLNRVVEKLNCLPALIFSEESRQLKSEISGVNSGDHFVLQAGNCAERFSDCNGPKIHNFLRIYNQLAMIIHLVSGRKVIQVGRVAGQYAKPRSSKYENRGAERLPSFRGENVNGMDWNKKVRTPNPNRLIDGYFHSVATLNLIRAFVAGNYTSIENLSDWQQHFFSTCVDENKEYQMLVCELSELRQLDVRMTAGNATGVKHFFCSHEGLLLDYESAFARLDTIHGGFFCTSAHFLWIGERTRDPEGAHVEFFRGINNPIGVKVGPHANKFDLIMLAEILNPCNEPGRLSFICRMGKEKIGETLPPIMKAVVSAGCEVTWICDPMHGNTLVHNGYKVRLVEDIKDELSLFFELARENGVTPGGVHLELTEENVTECVGGVCEVRAQDVPHNYLSSVDPRLNAAQAVEVALFIGKLLRGTS